METNRTPASVPSRSLQSRTCSTSMSAPTGLSEQIVGEDGERSVSAPVIEQRAARRCRRKLAREREAAPVTPGHDRIAAEDLLSGVMSVFEEVARGGGQGQTGRRVSSRWS